MRYPTRSVSLVLSTLALIWLPSVGSGQTLDRPPGAPQTRSKADPIVEQLVEGHNKERAKEMLPPLKLEPKLTEASIEHARDMAEHNKMSHEGSDDSSPAQRVANAGYRYLRTGENVAEGYKEVADVMLGWMESPGHKKNILGDYTEIGVAKVVGKDKRPYWCAVFGKPMPRLDPDNAAKDLVKRLNEKRETAKLPALVVDEKLVKAAQDQAVELAKQKSQGGATANFDGIDRNLYSELAVSTANSHPDAESMTRVVFDSQGIKAQVLGKFTKIGTGYAISEDGVPYWCLILAKPNPSATKKSRR